MGFRRALLLILTFEVVPLPHYGVMWLTNLAGKIQLYHVNKSYDNTDIDKQIYWETGLKSPQGVILTDKLLAWEGKGLANRQLTSMLGSSA